VKRLGLLLAVVLVPAVGVLGQVLTSETSLPRRSGWPLGLELERALEAEGLAPSEAGVALGRRLFFDPALSRDRSVSCASCHDPRHAFAGTERVSTGVAGRVGGRNAPTLVNRVAGLAHFWDGRADDLVEQALGPLFAPLEMDMDEALVLERLAEQGYAREFRAVYGQDPSLALLARALAEFELTLLSGDAPFDRHEWLGEEEALDASARRGLALFRGQARCTLCHTGTNFSDEQFHHVGTAAGDDGRLAVTGDEADRGRFKTPTLRNVALTAPYMHDGQLATLAEVVAHYARGEPHAGSELEPLELDAGEQADLVAFLESLTGTVCSVWVADLEEKLASLR